MTTVAQWHVSGVVGLFFHHPDPCSTVSLETNQVHSPTYSLLSTSRSEVIAHPASWKRRICQSINRCRRMQSFFMQYSTKSVTRPVMMLLGPCGWGTVSRCCRYSLLTCLSYVDLSYFGVGESDIIIAKQNVSNEEVRDLYNMSWGWGCGIL